MKVRKIVSEDAEQFIQVVREVESQADYMLMGPGERSMNVEQQRKLINRIHTQENAVILAAEENNRLIGYLMAIGGTVSRNRHSAYIVVGILREFRGQGVGTRLFQTLEIWAKQQGIKRLELTAVTKNTAGIALYQKSGFEIEGTKRKSLIIDEEFHDEYYMSKIIL
ncbi:GNAT family N-acetyltransferase [Rossellomorea aquimaris]|uniref:GNAT family N-acetyltransferase n=1 Tax=Rossellomorea aquimaris TaxID=189382 RepID=UPI001CD4B74E|nr:GNAT family N-acetyltransferase [Rossellomorea aquimaris]MCA1053738.1 GNAT family N-acetyltransferase [Rossellomorea aquimaris]